MLPDYINSEVIPHKPGVYIYRNQGREILYVGKAIDLFNRVSSYFSGRPSNSRTTHLVQNIASVETIVVESELEALILEANLIKTHLPPYNIRLTDDKDYLYIVITQEDFPKIITARKKDLSHFKKYFGPFPSSTTVRTTLKKLRRIFPWCSNPIGPQNKTHRPCFYYHLKLCPGACVGAISKQEYLKIINRFFKFLEGKKQELIDELALEMEQHSQRLEFEEASLVKRIIEGIGYITQPTKIQGYLENPNFLENLNTQAMEQLQIELKLQELPIRIEGYDISNLGGQEATGSMVVLTNGEIDKSQYRKFKIRITGKPNDVGMHKEMMSRRLKHQEWPLPQLFLIDGGRGQVRGAKEQLEKAGVDLPIYGLAKREEWLYPPEGEVVKLPRRSLALRMLQKIRNESHRFAINYHRKLRSKTFLPKQTFQKKLMT